MATPASAVVVDQTGRRGVLTPLAESDGNGPQALIRFAEDQTLTVALDQLVPQPDDTFYLPLDTQAAMGAASATVATEQVIPVVTEELQVSKQQFETRTYLHKVVHERTEQIDEVLQQETVEVERVPVNRQVDSPVAIHQEGDTFIIPVCEEVLVIQKQLWLREEIHVQKRKKTIRQTEPVTVRHEEVVVESTPPVIKAKP